MPLVPFACSLRVTDPGVSLAALESGLAGLVAVGRLHDAALRFDHVALTVDATTREEALQRARAILLELGARRVIAFAALPVTVRQLR